MFLDFDYTLKTDSDLFVKVWNGEKTSELRKHSNVSDSGYTNREKTFYVEQKLLLRESVPKTIYEPTKEIDVLYTGRAILIEVTHVLDYTEFPEGLKPGYCSISFAILERINHEVYAVHDSTNPGEIEDIEPVTLESFDEFTQKQAKQLQKKILQRSFTGY